MFNSTGVEKYVQVCARGATLNKASVFVAGCYNRPLSNCDTEKWCHALPHSEWVTRPPEESLHRNWLTTGLGCQPDHPSPVRLEGLRMNMAVERNAGMFWVSPWGLLFYNYQSSKRGFNRSLRRLDLCPVEYGGYNGSMSDLNLRNLKGKKLVEGPNKCGWEVTTFLRQLVKTWVRCGHTRQSCPVLVLDPPKKAVLKGKEVSAERSWGQTLVLSGAEASSLRICILQVQGTTGKRSIGVMVVVTRDIWKTPKAFHCLAREINTRLQEAFPSFTRASTLEEIRDPSPSTFP